MPTPQEIAQAAIDKMNAAIARDETVDGSARDLIVNLNRLYREANAISPAAVSALADRLTASTDATVAAVLENTPAANP